MAEIGRLHRQEDRLPINSRRGRVDPGQEVSGWGWQDGYEELAMTASNDIKSSFSLIFRKTIIPEVQDGHRPGKLD